MTTVGLMVYAVAISVLLAAAAWLAERGLARSPLPTRWVWAAALVVSVGLPAFATLDGNRPGSEALVDDAGAGTVVSIETFAPPAEREVQGVISVITAKLLSWRRVVGAGVERATRIAAGGPAWLSVSLAVAWAIASIALAALLVASASRLSRRADGWPREVLGGRAVRMAADLGPATLGLVRPEIVLPRWAVGLSARRLDLILAHEEEHVRSRDPLLLALGLAAIVAFPWNPVLWWQHRRLRDSVEVDCDRRVLRRGAAADIYGDLLLWMGTHRQLTWLPATTMKGSKSLLERRLTAMKSTTLRKALPRTIGASIIASGLVAVACSTEPPVASDEMEPAEAVVEGNPGVADVWVEPDGRVYVNDEPHRMEEVSEVIRELEAASDDRLVVSISGDPTVPYGVVADLQEAIQASGVFRVVFEMRPRPRRAPTGDPSDVLDGLGIVLPTTDMQEPQEVSVRNVLFLVVQPSGVVEVRRGASAEVQRVRPADVEAIWRRDVALNPRLIAAVQTHRDANYASMLQVLDALHAAEAQRISLQALQG